MIPPLSSNAPIPFNFHYNNKIIDLSYQKEGRIKQPLELRKEKKKPTLTNSTTADTKIKSRKRIRASDGLRTRENLTVETALTTDVLDKQGGKPLPHRTR